ncbi:MAG: competence protein, partial [Cyanobacteria bacterium P01_F01_bin.153]
MAKVTSSVRKPVDWALTVLDGQRGHLLPWMPVFYGAGIGGYFGLRFEPGQYAVFATILTVTMGIWSARRLPRAAPLFLAVVFVGLGGLSAAHRTHSVAAPVLEFRYYGPIEGRIVGIDRSSTDRLRLTLDRVVLTRLAPDDTPDR